MQGFALDLPIALFANAKRAANFFVGLRLSSAQARAPNHDLAMPGRKQSQHIRDLSAILACNRALARILGAFVGH